MPNNRNTKKRNRNGNGSRNFANKPAKRSLVNRLSNPYKAALQLRKQLDSVPIYAILCHSAICNSYASCKPDRPGEPFFYIPATTFLFNLTSGGESCTPPIGIHMKLIANTETIRNSVIADEMQESVRTFEKPLLSTATRATSGQLYPNLSCTFIENEGIPDELGVYEIGGAKLPLEKTKAWYLDEIILEVYKVTGMNHGIFIFTGCSGNYNQVYPNSLAGTAKAIDAIRYADLDYKSKVPTMPILGINRGTTFNVSTPDPQIIVDMALTFGDPLDLWSEDKEDIETAKNMLIEIVQYDQISQVAAHYRFTIPEVMAHISVALKTPIKGLFPAKYNKDKPAALKIFLALTKANRNAANSNAGTNLP